MTHKTVTVQGISIPLNDRTLTITYELSVQAASFVNGAWGHIAIDPVTVQVKGQDGTSQEIAVNPQTDTYR